MTSISIMNLLSAGESISLVDVFGLTLVFETSDVSSSVLLFAEELIVLIPFGDDSPDTSDVSSGFLFYYSHKNILGKNL